MFSNAGHLFQTRFKEVNKQLTLKSGDKGNMRSNQYQFWSA